MERGMTGFFGYRGQLAATALLGAMLYCVLATTTILLTSDGRNHATVWPADAVILAILLSRERSFWPSALAFGWMANLLANALTRDWTLGLVCYGAINMAQIFLAASAIRRTASSDDLLANPAAVLNFLFWAGLAAPSAGAIAGSVVSAFNFGEAFGPSFIRWYASSALGFVILTPFLKSVFDGGYRRVLLARTRFQKAEGGGLLLVHLAVTALVFSQSRLPLLFLPLCTLLLLAFRCGRVTTQTGVVMVGISGALAALYRTGPVALIHQGPVFEAVFFQCYLAVMLGVALPVAALVASREEALAEVARREELLRMRLAHSPDATFSFSGDRICQWAGGDTQNLLGFSADDCRGVAIDEIARWTSPDLIGLHDAAAKNPAAVHIADIAPVVDPARTLEASFKAVGSEGVVVALRDVSARRARERAVERLVLTDPLTGVLNRAGFDEIFARFEASPEPGCLAIVDVDHFKRINDNFGHQSGDKILQQIASELRSGAGAGSKVARLGGDEFALLIGGDLDHATRLLNRLRRNIADALWRLDDGSTLQVSVSCGIAALDAAPGSEVFRRADAALYRAKKYGRNRVDREEEASSYPWTVPAPLAPRRAHAG